MKTLLKKRWVMGLFNLGKKKDSPLTSESVPPPPSQPMPAQLAEAKEEVDFDSLLDETRASLSGSPPSQAQPMPDIKAQAQAKVEVKELPSLELPPQQNQAQMPSIPDLKMSFELPDFMDEEAKAMEEAKQIEKEFTKKQEPVKPVVIEQPKPKITPEPAKPMKLEVYQEPPKQKPFPEKINWAEEDFKPPVAKAPKEPFVDINKYFEIKDDFEEIKKLLSHAQDLIEQDANISREKGEKYLSLADNLNYLQEKLMLMDTKLFES
jgi:hypothetical protein